MGCRVASHVHQVRLVTHPNFVLREIPPKCLRRGWALSEFCAGTTRRVARVVHSDFPPFSSLYSSWKSEYMVQINRTAMVPLCVFVNVFTCGWPCIIRPHRRPVLPRPRPAPFVELELIYYARRVQFFFQNDWCVSSGYSNVHLRLADVGRLSFGIFKLSISAIFKQDLMHSSTSFQGPPPLDFWSWGIKFVDWWFLSEV